MRRFILFLVLALSACAASSSVDAKQGNDYSIECHDSSTSTSYTVSCTSNSNGETSTYRLHCTSSGSSVHCSDSTTRGASSSGHTSTAPVHRTPSSAQHTLTPPDGSIESDQSGLDQRFAGTGNTTISGIALDAGTYDITISSHSQSPFSVTIQSSSMEVMFAVTLQGPVTRTKPLELADQGAYLMKVSAEGSWLVRIAEAGAQ